MNWRDFSREVEIRALSVFFSHFETMLKNAINHTTNTERGFNHVRHVLLFHLHFGLIFERDVLFCQHELLILNFDRDLIITSELVRMCFTLIVINIVEVLNHECLIFLELFSKYLFVEQHVC